MTRAGFRSRKLAGPEVHFVAVNHAHAGVDLRRTEFPAAFRVLLNILVDHNVGDGRDGEVQLALQTRQPDVFPRILPGIIGAGARLFHHGPAAVDADDGCGPPDYFGVTRILQSNQLQCAFGAGVSGDLRIPRNEAFRLTVHAEQIDGTRILAIVRAAGALHVDGSGAGSRSTGVGFLDHMLDLLARHGRLDLDVAATGDLQTGAHHTVEDVGICIGQALDQALGDRARIFRYGNATIPMDEARASTAIDISGRGLLVFEAEMPVGAIGNYDHELTEEFLRALATNAKLTLHVRLEAGTNVHHVIEAIFKSLARALRAATTVDPTESGVPSTKGTLT